jgi:Carboxypeptidase regulatory-like domain/TonB dependent receptor
LQHPQRPHEGIPLLKSAEKDLAMTQQKNFEMRESSVALRKKYRSAVLRGPGWIAEFCVFVLITVLPICIKAQVLYGTLVGNVTDQSGAVVEGATVVATNTGTGISHTESTDTSGIYRFTDLEAGTYKVSISAQSFAVTNGEGILVQTNVVRRFDAQLKPAAAGVTVTVTGAAPEMQTDNATPTVELESAQVQNIDATAGQNMRNFQSLLALVPGTIQPSTQEAGHSESGNPGDTMMFNTNGMSGSNNLTRIDGVSDIYPWLPELTAYTPSTEAIATVNVVTNSMNAEQGFASGAAVNVTTKSGSNTFHGSAWEYNMTSALMAHPYFTPASTPIPKYILNQFGANYGGPIKRNKAFFFGNWERTRRAVALAGYQTVPSAAMLAGNFVGVTDSKGSPVTIYDPTTCNSTGTGCLQVGAPGDPNGSGTPNVLSPSQISYPASQMVKLLQANNNADLPSQTNNNLLSVNGISNDWYGRADGEYTRDNIDSRVDFNLSKNSTLFGRYGIQKTNLFDPQTLGAAGGTTFDGGQPGNAPSIVQSIGVGATYSFLSNLLLDANVGYTRQGFSAKNTDLGTDSGLSYFQIPGTNGTCSLCGGQPAFIFSSLSNLGNQNRSNPFQFRDNAYVAAANLSGIKGKHSTRYGIEFDRFDINHFQPQNTYGPRGGFDFTGNLSSDGGAQAANAFTDWADFLFGYPAEVQKDTQYLNPAASRESVWSAYAQDQWQATEKLTVTYGIRYEYYPMITRDHGGMDIFNPANGNLYVEGSGGVPAVDEVQVGKGMIVPRFGLAYRIDSKTVARAGFGISTNPDSFRNVLTTYPSVVSQTLVGNTSYVPPQVPNSSGTLVPEVWSPVAADTVGIPALTPPTLSPGSPVVALGALGTPKGSLGATTLPMNYRRGYYESYNAALEHEFPGAITVNATYVGEQIRREVPGININAATAPGQTAAQEPMNLLYGITAGITSEIPDGTGHYNGLQVHATHRFTGNNMVALSYTWSRSRNDFGENSDGESALKIAMPQPYWNLNRGLSDYDQPQNLQVYGNYALPFGKGQAHLQSGPGGYVLGGWQLSGALSRASGFPFTITGSGSALGPSTSGSTEFADAIAAPASILAGHNLSKPYFNPADFADPLADEKAANGGQFCNSTTNVALCRFGSAGRNSVRGPGLTNPSLSVARNFAITERFGFVFQATAFNLTNTPQLNNPNSSVTGGNFGYITGATANSSRELRFSGRINF